MRPVKGLTLIELMVAVAVLAILMAVAAPSFTDSIARRRLEGIANEASADLQYTRTQSISANTAIALVASSTGYVIGSYKTLTINSMCSLGTVSPGTLPLTIAFEANRGTATSTGTLLVSCTGTAATLQITVDSMGRVQMCSPGGVFGGYTTC